MLGERTRCRTRSAPTRGRGTPPSPRPARTTATTGKYDSGRKSAFSTSAGKVWPPSGKRLLPCVRSAIAGGVPCRQPARYCAPPRTRLRLSQTVPRAASLPRCAVNGRRACTRCHAAVMQRRRPAAGPARPARCRCRRCRGRAGGCRSPPPARRRRAARPRRHASGSTGTASSASPCTSRTGGRPVSLGRQRVGRDQRAGKGQDGARRRRRGAGR